jgi:hypothetical protein
MRHDDRIQAILPFGFTERQARFVALVLRHGGVRPTSIREHRWHRERWTAMQRILRQARQAWLRAADRLRAQPGAAVSPASQAAVPRYRRGHQQRSSSTVTTLGCRAPDDVRCRAAARRSRMVHDGVRKGRHRRQSDQCHGHRWLASAARRHRLRQRHSHRIDHTDRTRVRRPSRADVPRDGSVVGEVSALPARPCIAAADGSDMDLAARVPTLQDDRFETIAAAVEEGRVVFDNIRKFVSTCSVATSPRFSCCS